MKFERLLGRSRSAKGFAASRASVDSFNLCEGGRKKDVELEGGSTMGFEDEEDDLLRSSSGWVDAGLVA